jgi:putative tRNA adenosine deaminase-associated protein
VSLAEEWRYRFGACHDADAMTPRDEFAGPDVTTSADSAESVAVMVTRDGGAWQAEVLPERLAADLPGLIAVLGQQADGGAIGLVNVADEFFVAVRVAGGDVRLLLSDATAAVAWDLAAQVTDRLDIDPAGDDDMERVLPSGDLGIFADLGLDEMALGAILSDVDAYADEMLLAVTGALGFGSLYQAVTR